VLLFVFSSPATEALICSRESSAMESFFIYHL
jgi:hypothetical protein